MNLLLLAYGVSGLAACIAARKVDAPRRGKVLCYLLFPLHAFALGFLAFWGGIVAAVMDEVGGFWKWLMEEPKDGR